MHRNRLFGGVVLAALMLVGFTSVASAQAPLPVPNAFLADPPLDEVVARSIEAGVRGESAGGFGWQFGIFQTTNLNDILFQTVGGALAHADPHMDLPPVLIALGATIAVVGPAGERTIAVEDLFTGY